MVYGEYMSGSCVLIDHKGVATHECFQINHKPDYLLTGLYYDLQISN